jgi:hypothetical protein
MTTTPPANSNKKIQGGYLNISMVDEDEPLTPNRERSNQNFLEEFKQTSQGRRIYDNLDEFFQRVYQYFLEKGFFCIITLRITKLLYFQIPSNLSNRRTLFIFILFNFIFLMINWSKITTCKDDCFEFGNLISKFGFYHFFIYLCSFSLSIYFIYQNYKYIKETKHFYEIKKFYNIDLEIDEV